MTMSRVILAIPGLKLLLLSTVFNPKMSIDGLSVMITGGLFYSFGGYTSPIS